MATDESGTNSEFTLNRTSFLMGYRMGCIAAAQRKPQAAYDAELADGVLYIRNANAVLNGGTLEVT